MFYHLLFIHLFRPFLRYNPANSPLPPQVSPRRVCTQAATQISKLLRQYKRTYGLRQICNIAVYIAHSACIIHLLNLPEKNAKRDIVYGTKHLEEIAEGWRCASRTLHTLQVLAQRWKIGLPEEAAAVLSRFACADMARDESCSPKASAILSKCAQAPPQPAAGTYSPEAAPSSTSPASSDRAPGSMDDRIFQAPDNVLPQGAFASMGYHIPALQHYSAPGIVSPPCAPAQFFSTMPGHTQPTTLAALSSAAELGQQSAGWLAPDQSDFAVGFGNWNGADPDQALCAINEDVGRPYVDWA
jgi:hypothetical protein